MGQFSQPFDKRQPYETDIRVPLFVQFPNKGPQIRRTSDFQVATIDILPTIIDLAGIPTETNEVIFITLEHSQISPNM